MDGIVASYNAETFFRLPQGDAWEAKITRRFAYEANTPQRMKYCENVWIPGRKDLVYESRQSFAVTCIEDPDSRVQFKATLSNSGMKKDAEIYLAFNKVDRLAQFIGWPEELEIENLKMWRAYYGGDTLTIRVSTEYSFPVIEISIANALGLWRSIVLNYETPEARQQFMAFARSLQLLVRDAHTKEN